MTREFVQNPKTTKQNDLFNTRKLLNLAKKAHAEYLLKSQEKDLNNAIDYYGRALRVSPHLSEPYYKLAYLLYSKHEIELDECLLQCKKAVQLEPNSAKARLYYGYFLNIAGYTKLARTEFVKSVKLDFLGSSRARLALGASIFDGVINKELSKSYILKSLHYVTTGILLSAADKSVIMMFARFLLLNLSIFKYRFNGTLLRRVGKYKMAISNFDAAAKNTANAEDFYVKSGDTAYQANDINLAISSYKKALEKNPNNIEAITKLTRLLQKYSDGRDDEIIVCYNRILKNNPRNSKLYYELGNIYLKKDDRFSARNAFRMALEIEPENPFYLNSYAYSLIQLKNYDEALVHYKKAIKINPDNKWTSIVCQAQGSIYQQIKGNYEAAITSFEMAILLDKENYDAYQSLGDIYQDMGDIETAIEYYCQALKIKENPRSYRALGIAFWENDDIDEAIIAFEKCISLDETNYEAYDNLGTALLDGSGDVERAMKCFKSALSINHNDALAYFNLGKIYQILQMNTKAAENYQMALDLNKITEIMDSTEIEKRLYSIFD